LKIAGIKSKLLLAFITVLIIITGLNVGLAIYLTTQQSEREAFASLTRQTLLLQNALQETTTDLRAVAEKNVAGTHNLNDLATLYVQTRQLTAYPERAAAHERGLLFNKIISLNRLQVVLQTADFSSAAVYLDNELSHYVTTTEAGMRTIRVDDRPLIKTGQNRAGDLEFTNWPNWAEGDPSPLITPRITPVKGPTISFDFTAEPVVVLQIVVPVQATTQTVMRENITLGSPEGLLVNHPSIATPETLSQSQAGQNKPVIIGAFVFKKVFDQAFLEGTAEKTGLLPALYSPDGIHQIQLVDMQMNPADLAQWAGEDRTAIDRRMQQRTLAVGQTVYYQALALWQFGEEPRLIVGFAQSAASTSQKVRETVTGLVGVAGLVLLVGGILGYLLFDRLVKPIRVLTAAVSRIGLSVRQQSPGRPVTPLASDKLVEIDLRASDEVGQLTTAFNAMIRQLRQSFETLEQRVVERTEDLQIAKEKALEAQAAAEAANRAKSVFLANMSHELRTPLNAVLGFSQVMKNAAGVTAEQKDNLEIITRSGEHLLTLINNVLEISKIESGRVELEASPIDLVQLLEEIKSLMHVPAHEKGLEFTLEVTSDLPRHITVDGGKLRQVLLNLVGNAIKFTERGAVGLRATARRHAAAGRWGVRFDVSDTGPGIGEEDRERIFSAFVQLGDQAPPNSGTGLGLAISKQYVELMGGKIGVAGEPGKGSRFHFEIPVKVLSPGAMPAAPRRGRVTGLADGQPHHRLLIAEDNSMNRLLLRKLLAPLGFELREADNGQAAVAVFEKWRPHLIWMDIRMPVMDGLEATRHIKASDTGGTTKIIAVTAHALEGERREILAAGCDDFIRKPYRDVDIFDALGKHLGIRFVYEEGSPPSTDAVSLDAAALADLPDALLNDLEQALVHLDIGAVDLAIEGIRAQHPSQADALRAVARDLQFGRMLQMIRAGGGEARPEDETCLKR
jgi:signal transduction histidine kinase/ActR/RegA family two-component response regulator